MSSSVKAPPITVQQYLGFRSPPGYRDELINGEIVVSPERKPLHHDLAEKEVQVHRSGRTAINHTISDGTIRLSARLPEEEIVIAKIFRLD